MIIFVYQYDALAENHLGSARALILALAAALMLSAGCGADSDDPLPSRPVTSGDDATSYSDGQQDGDTADASGYADADESSDTDDAETGATTCSEGSTSCTAETLELCDDGEHTRTFACAEGCSDTDACIGDSCEAAIVADISTESVVIEGDQQAFTTQWNAQGRQGCSLYADEEAGPTEGPEVFLRITGHQAGDAVVFDADEGGSSYAFYVIDQCDAAVCLDAGAFDEDYNNRHTWQASTDEDVWVAAEVFGPSRDRPFRIEIRRE